MSNNWSTQTSFKEVCRRAGGRRRVNAMRQERAFSRQLKVMRVVNEMYAAKDLSAFEWGFQARLARRFGVSQATLSRDLAEIRRWSWHTTCPTCEGTMTVGHYEGLVAAGVIRRPPKDLQLKALVDFCERVGLNRRELSPQLVIEGGGFDEKARVLAIAEDQKVAVVAVDPIGDGGGFVLVHFQQGRGGWRERETIDAWVDCSTMVGYWDRGQLVYGVGRFDPGATAVVRFRGQLHWCPVSEAGVWAFVSLVGEDFDGVLPEVLRG